MESLSNEGTLLSLKISEHSENAVETIDESETLLAVCFLQ